jgi:NADH-quinone oxidoreductase subunit G/NADP-reducing hydrogenase subunit HndD
MISLTIDGRTVEVDNGATILDAAKKAGVRIPTLCHIKDLSPTGACRMCVVEAEGRPGLLASCAYPAENGMKILTASPRVLNTRKTIIELLLASHPFECLTCTRNQNCELQHLAAEYNISEVPYKGKKRHHYTDFSSPAIVRDTDKCILCGRCVRICEEIQGVSAIDFTKRGFNTMVLPAFNHDLSETGCVNCGQCILACPTGALHEVSAIDRVVAALQSGSKHMIAQMAPAIRVSLGEFFNMDPGANVTHKVSTALRRIGFKNVFDTDFTADLTIMEEGSELVRRVKAGGPFPMFTSCCPGWIKFAEHNYPEFLPNLSTCKSPQQMMGSLIKKYYAEKAGVDPKDVYVVSIMPCTAKKYEAARPEFADGGNPDIDAVLTTRELAKLINRFGIDFPALPETPFDEIIGTTSGSGDIFAASGGVMESALRSAYYLITGKDLANIELLDVRGFDGVKETSIEIDGLKLKLAVVNRLENARRLIEKIKAGEAEYHFIEVMTCPGGCVGGGGQIHSFDSDVIKRRIASIYALDKKREIRLSYKNPKINELYKGFLHEPGSHVAHELLHTRYFPRQKKS